MGDKRDKKKVTVYDPPKRESKLLVILPPGRFKSCMLPKTYREFRERLKAGEKFIIFDDMSDNSEHERFFRK